SGRQGPRTADGPGLRARAGGGVPRGPSKNGARMPFFESQPMSLPGRSPVEARILDAARRCLLQYGSAKLGMNDVAKIAGVSRGTVYNYFADRTTLLSAVVEVLGECFIEDFASQVGSHSGLAEQMGAGAECI